MKQYSLALFVDGKITWYRIVALFSYGPSMASDFNSNGRRDLALQIPGLMASEVFTGEIR